MREFNAVVLGAGGVGKSSLTLRFMRDIFVESYDPTVQDAYRRTFEVDKEISSLEVLDTAGAEQFTALNDYYIKSAGGFILVFSLTQAASLREVENVRQQIYRVKGMGKPVPIVIVGTKSDLIHERQVGAEQMLQLATAWGVPFYETSAKRNLHVNEAFEDLVRQMRIQYPEGDRKKKQRRSGGKGCIVM